MNLKIKTGEHGLFPYKDLTECQMDNSLLNQKECEEQKEVLFSYPRRIVIELTNDCNLHCKMCGRCYNKFNIKILNMEMIKWLAPILKISEEITLMGWGEPTLYPHFSELIKFLDKYPVKKYICTNGTRLLDIKDILFDYQIDLCAISINGTTPETNDKIRAGSKIEQVFNSIKIIVDEKRKRGIKWPFLSVVFCLSNSNRKDLYDLANKVAELGVDRIKIVYLTAFGSEMEKEVILSCVPEIKKLFQFLKLQCNQKNIELELPFLPGEDPTGEKKHRDCVFPWRDLFIGSDGWVRPCMSTSERLFALDIQQSFIKQWNHEKLCSYRKNVNNEAFMSESCKSCYHSSTCNWNMIHSFLQYDEQFSPNWGNIV